MKKISFECSDESVAPFVNIINKLSQLALKNKSLKVRVGGNEYCFQSSVDNISEPLVDDKCIDDTELNNYVVIRENAILQAAPSPAQPVPIVSNTDGVNTNPSSPSYSAPNDNGSKLSNGDEETIREIILDWLDEGKLFTSHDVTKEARNQGLWVGHKDSKKVVEEFFAAGEMRNYTRTIINMGLSLNPFVYHPQSEDANSYTNQK